MVWLRPGLQLIDSASAASRPFWWALRGAVGLAQPEHWQNPRLSLSLLKAGRFWPAGSVDFEQTGSTGQDKPRQPRLQACSSPVIFFDSDGRARPARPSGPISLRCPRPTAHPTSDELLQVGRVGHHGERCAGVRQLVSARCAASQSIVDKNVGGAHPILSCPRPVSICLCRRTRSWFRRPAVLAHLPCL